MTSGDITTTFTVSLDQDELLTPDAAEVARLLPALTVNEYGTQLGEFTTATRPTLAEVEALWDFAAADVTANIEGSLPTSLVEEARRLTAIGTVLAILAGALPEQATADNGAVAHYERMYQAGLARLRQESGDTTNDSFGSLPITTTLSESVELLDA